MNLVTRWRSLTLEFGGSGLALLYVLHRVLQKASGGRAAVVPYLLVAQPVGNSALGSVKPDSATVVREARHDDALLPSFPRPTVINEQRFSDGARCHVASVKGDFAGHIWIARQCYREDEVRCTYLLADPERCVWDFDVYIEPRFRLGRTMARLWRGVDDALVAQGVQWSFSRINRFNLGSVRSHQRLGAREVGRISFVVLGPVQIRLGGGAAVTISLSASQSPVVRLTPPMSDGDA